MGVARWSCVKRYSLIEGLCGSCPIGKGKENETHDRFGLVSRKGSDSPRPTGEVFSFHGVEKETIPTPLELNLD
jgi:hypothetical protein